MSDFLDRLLLTSTGAEPQGVVQPRLRSRFEDPAPFDRMDTESTSTAPSYGPASSESPGSRGIREETAAPFPHDLAPPLPQRAPVLPATVAELPEPSHPEQKSDLGWLPAEPLLASPTVDPLKPRPQAELLDAPAGPAPVLPLVRTEQVTMRLEHVERLVNSPALPELSPAEPPPIPEPPAPIVRVTIGRIEVHSPPPTPAPRAAAPAPPKRSAQPVRSLDAYLKGRNEDRR